jgi:hypothetical protein
MRAPSVGQAIGLQGVDDSTRRLGNLVFKMGQAEQDRNLKRGVIQAQKNQKAQEEAEKKFAFPSGAFHRLILPKVNQTQKQYVAELKNLKLERPNDWQNGVSDLANRYDQEMSVYATRSKDLQKYDDMTATQDAGSSYFTKNWDKFNSVYEKANDFDDLVVKLEAVGWEPDAQLQVRPIGSISYTPFRNMKPKETLEQNITQMVTQLGFKSNTKSKAYGYQQEKELQVRPVTYAPSDLGVSVEEIARYNNIDPSQVPSIEGVVDNFLSMPDGGFQTIVQYADQNNLKSRFDENGQLIKEDFDAIKSHIMGWAKDFASPKTTSAMMRPQQTILQAPNEEVSSATADISPGTLASATGGDKSQKLGIMNFSFDKDPQSIDARPEDTYSGEFVPVSATTLPNVKADGVVVMAVDNTGKPMIMKGSDAENIRSIAGADVFVRLKSGSEYYYKRYNKYANISNQFLKKPNAQLEAEVQKLLNVAAKYDVEIPKRKQNKKLKYSEIVATP